MARSVTIPPSHAESIRGRGPVVDAGAFAGSTEAGSPGEAVRLVSREGDFLAWGLWTGEPRFPCRLVSWDPSDVIDAGFFRERARQSAARRLALPLTRECDSWRVVFAESDGLPGLVGDFYAGWLVVCLESQTMAPWIEAVVDGVAEALPVEGACLRGSRELRTLRGSAPPLRIEVHEYGLRYFAEPAEGQKTGWYLDQRDNRRTVASHAAGRRVLDVFSYTGGFSLASLAAGARSSALVDSSARALAVAREMLGPHASEARFLEGEAREVLRGLRSEGERFDLVVLDPPKLLPTGTPREAGERTYRSLNGLAASLLEPGGLLATFSCSGAMDRTSFDRVVLESLGGREARILARFGQPADHPILGSFRKSEYLKGLLVGVE